MVGHTHEDIDQMFSCVSRRLLKTSAMTLKDLGETIKEAYSPSPEIHILNYLPDVKSWIKPHVEDLSGHSEPHQFKLEKDGRNGAVKVHCRKWSTSKHWSPVTIKDGNDPIVLFDSTPKGAPSNVAVDLQTIIASMKTDVPKYGFQFSPEQKQWWKVFLEQVEQRQQEGAPRGPWLLKELKKCKTDTNLPPVSLLTEHDEEVHDELEKRFMKERREPKVLFVN